VTHQRDQITDVRCQCLMSISDADVWGLASTQDPHAWAVTCFSEEAKWSPTATYVANEWQDLHSALRWHFTTLFHQRTRGRINGRGSLPLALLLYLKPLNPYAPFTISLLLLGIFQTLPFLRTLCLPSLLTSTPRSTITPRYAFYFIIAFVLSFWCFWYSLTVLRLFRFSAFYDCCSSFSCVSVFFQMFWSAHISFFF